MNLPDAIRQNLLPLLLALLGVIFLSLGALQLVSHLGNQSSEVTFEQPSPGSADSSDKIAIDIEGAVINPGVYEVRPDSRLVDALAAAGGLSEDADRAYVQKSINLAQKVSDGIKIYIPHVGEQVLSAQSGSSTGSSSTININLASASDLDVLPGIGKVTAEKIISGRPYAGINELVERKIVGQAEFEKIKDQISAY